MLKDLDNRQSEQSSHATTVNMPIDPAGKSPVAVVVITISIIAISIAATLAATYFWQIYKENTELRNSLQIQDAGEKNQQTTVLMKDSEVTKVATQMTPSQQITQQDLALENVISQETVPTKSITKSIPKEVIVAAKAKSEAKSEVEPETEPEVSLEARTETKLATKSTSVAPEKPATLSITRRQLSPEQLSAKKMKQAETAMLNNDLTKAEHLFEDVLLILPSQQEARKQLAALWFGRKSYQPALNVLAQGIALTPNNSELRLMQARIYLKQKRVESAFRVLQQLATSSSVEYQSLLASVAQQLGQTDAAILAYKTLTQLQPHIGRWWLGLAISYDGNSQFTLATQAYESALTQNNLSTSSTQFAQQRIVQLGE